MKIAVAFFGIPRSSSVCYPTIQKNVLDALPGSADVNCFYHLYQQRHVINPRSREAGVLTTADYAPFVDNMAGILEKPGECLQWWDFDTLMQYGDAWGDGFYSLRNLVHQLNSLHMVTTLIQADAPDFVVYLRPDLYYHSPLPDHAFSFAHDWRRTVHVPSWQWSNGINDRFAVCGSDAFLAYGFRIQDALEFCRGGNELHGERLLKYAMVNGQTRIRTFDTRATRVRTGGRFHHERFSILHSTGWEVPVQIFNRVSRVRTKLDRMAAARLSRLDDSCSI